MFIQRALFFLTLLFCLVFSTFQTANATPEYQATQLISHNAAFDLSAHAYIYSKDASKLNVQDIENIVREGKLEKFNKSTAYINVNEYKDGLWIIFPIINKTELDTWDFRIGSFRDGLYSPLKDIVIYNMTTKTLIINSLNPELKNYSVRKNISLNIPSKGSAFYIVYIRANLTIPSIIRPQISASNSAYSPLILNGLLATLLTFAVVFLFIRSTIITKSISNGLLLLTWVPFLILVVNGNYFNYTPNIDFEMFVPFAWMISAVSLTFCLALQENGRGEILPSIAIGISSAGLIISIVGIILLKSLPDFSGYIIYTPVFTTYILSFLYAYKILADTKNNNIVPHATYPAFFLFMSLVWLTLLNHDLVPINEYSLLAPQVFYFISCISTLITIETVAKGGTHYSHEAISLFTEKKLNQKNILTLKEAKEKSEHNQLMQVIERERRVMSELQLKSTQQQEDMRKALQNADEANRAKSAFLAVVSHEIRTPMTGIMGMLRLLQDTQLSKEQKEYTSTIKDSGDAMLALLNDILDFEKIESGKMELENINFDLHRLARSIYTLMRGHAEAKNVTLILEMDSNIPHYVFGDPTRLRQVLLNLINNAIKFTSKGSVIFRIRNISDKSSHHEGIHHQIYFAIQDSGIGIGPESQKKLFMPFAQADSSISRKYGGTGLGLAISKRLIEAMGGAISINSKQGEGSTFFFTIDMVEGSEILGSFDEAASIEQSSLIKREFSKKLSILVVDDNGINQKVISGFVEKLGCASDIASTGEDALQKIGANKYDAIFMDIELPDMNGIEVTQHIRRLAHDTKSKIPIIALTGNAQSSDIKNYYNAGMNDVAEKPATFERIADILQKVDNDYYLLKKQPEEITFAETTSSIPYTPTDINNIAFQDSEDTPEHEDDYNQEEEDSFELAVKQFEMKEQMARARTEMSTGEKTSSDYLDLNILNSLKSGLSTDQIKEILVGYYEKADELVADIGQAYLDGNMLNMNARAHELKGMAGNFGFAQVSQMCATIEKAAKNNMAEAAKSEIDMLGEIYAISRTELNNWLDS